MAVIGKIRERGTLLGIIVGGALALFVVGDFIGKGGRGNDPAIGTIAGKEIGMQEFSALVDRQIDLYRQNGTTVNDQLQQQVRNAVWNDLLRENTLMVQAEDAGFGNTISREEYDDIRFGNNILPDFKNNKNFKDPRTGQVDKEQLKKYFKYVQDNNLALFEMQKRTFVPQRIYAKYNALVKKSCFVNSAQVKDDWAAKNTKADFSFVAQRFTSEPDSLYPVAPAALQRYYDAHKNENKWEQKASRSFAYVRFAATPTAEDIESTRSQLAELKPEFEQAHGFKEDSALVAEYADNKVTTPTAYKEGTADHLNDSLITHADTGAVVGPFRDGNAWKLVKVAELADVPEARVRHILFSTQGKSPADQETIKARADSVLKVVKRDRSKFTAMVSKFSDDPGSKQSGGVYEWFDKKRMVPEFTKASFDEPVGAITLVKTSYGYHIVEVLGQRTRKERRVLTIDRKIAPVEAMKTIWKTANEFSLKHQDTASFRKSAAEKGLAYTPVDQLRPDQHFIPGLQEPDDVIRWVNHAEADAKSSEPLTSGDSYVVCSLTGIREAGAPELADVRDAFTKEVRKELKADTLMARMKGATNLDSLAKRLGVNVQYSGNMAFSANAIPGGYSDETAIGAIFGVADSTTSGPIKGDMAVYVAHIHNATTAGEMPKDQTDAAAKSLTTRARNQADGQAFNAIKETAHVVDQRSKYF